MARSFEYHIYYVKKNYSKILYDITKIKKIEKIYDAYNIEKSETIIAYVKSPVFLVPLTMSGLIITSQGLYIHPSNGNLVVGNKLPFDELCSYAISMEDDKAAVEMIGSNIVKDLWGCSLLGRNVIAEEITMFLNDLQKQLISEYSWALNQRNEMVEATLSKSKEELRICSFSRDTKNILNVLMKEERYSNKIAPVIAERVYRKNGLFTVETFVSNLSDYVSNRKIEEITQNLKSFEDNFIKDMSNALLIFDTKYLRNVLENLENFISDGTINSARMTAFISARLGETEQFKEAQKTVLNQLGRKEAFQIEYFKCMCTNTLMNSVFHTVANDSVPDSYLLKIKDNFGFDALHYAIMLGKKDTIDKLLDMDIYVTEEFSQQGNLQEKMLDYGVVAKLCGMENIYEICFNTSDYVKTQRKVFKSLNNRLNMRKVQIALQNQSVSSYSRAMSEASRLRDREKYEEYKEKYINAKNLVGETENIIRDIELEISELENEIKLYIYNLIKEIEKFTKTLPNSNVEYSKLLINIIKNSDVVLSGESSYSSKMYLHNDISFVLPENFDVDMPYIDMNANIDNIGDEFDFFWSEEFEADTEETATIIIERPYGNNWFSPEAHRNEAVLKSEFRELAKKYHPDIAKTEESIAIFQEINNERAEILDNLE